MEADERVEALHHESDSNTEEGMELRVKGFSPRALRQDFTIEALLSRLWKAHRTMAVANSDASSLLGGWSFRKDNLSRSLSHFVSLWDGGPTSIDRRNPEAPEIFFYQRRLTVLIMGQVNVAEELLFSQAAGNGFTARCLPSMDRERPKPPEDSSNSYQAALDTIAEIRALVIRRREDQDANVELLLGVQHRPVIYPETDARDLLAAAAAKFEVLADSTDNPPERGFWARAQEQTARLRRNPGLHQDPRDRDTTNLGTPALHPSRGGPGRGRHQLAWRPDEVLCYASSLQEDHPPRQRDYHHAPGETGQGGERGRDHRAPQRHRQDGQGRAEDERRDTGSGHRPAGVAQPFDTDDPEGPLHDGGPSRLSVLATFANNATF